MKALAVFPFPSLLSLILYRILLYHTILHITTLYSSTRCHALSYLINFCQFYHISLYFNLSSLTLPDHVISYFLSFLCVCGMFFHDFTALSLITPHNPTSHDIISNVTNSDHVFTDFLSSLIPYPITRFSALLSYPISFS